MKHKVEMQVVEDGMKAFFKRAHENARKLDRGEPLEGKTVIYFESASDMLRMLTTERVRLMEELREAGPVSITILAGKLGRNKRAVSRDVAAMREAGVLKTKYVSNAGHGRHLIVSPASKKIELKSEIYY
jgi:predicted transcriptional regulator